MHTPVIDPPRRGSGHRELFGLFCALWAVALLLDQLWWGGFELRSPHAVVVLAALWALLRPTSVGRFTAMAAAKVVAVALDLPFVGSHRLLDLICGTSVLGYLAWTTLRARRAPSASAVFDGIAPFLRISLIVVYAFAALAKLNTSFVDPTTSCAASMSRQIAWFDPSLLAGPWLTAPAIWATVLVEVGLPVLLAVPRTRLLALTLGGVFHTVLALAGNVPFTALAFAFYVTFLPLDTPERVRALLARHPELAQCADRVIRARGTRVFALGVLVAAWLVGAGRGAANLAPGLTGTPSAQVSILIADGTRLVIVLLALGGGVSLVISRRAAPGPPRYPTHSLRPRHPILIGGALLLVVNGLCPYLGLKTDTSFEMFSNLRTEPGAWNHLIVPEAVRVLGYQDQLVRVLASNDPGLVRRTTGGTRLVYFELERYLHAHPGTVATYTTTPGPSQAIQTIGPLPPGPTFAERLAPFRDVTPPSDGHC